MVVENLNLCSCSGISNNELLPLDGGCQVGVKGKANHPPLAPPIKGGEYLAAEGSII